MIDEAGFDGFEHGERVLVGWNVNGVLLRVELLQFVVVNEVGLVTLVDRVVVVSWMASETRVNVVARRRMIVRMKTIARDRIERALRQAFESHVERNVEKEDAVKENRS